MVETVSAVPPWYGGWVDQVKTFYFCLPNFQVQPSRRLLNFNNTTVARATFCTKWKSAFRPYVVTRANNIDSLLPSLALNGQERKASSLSVHVVYVTYGLILRSTIARTHLLSFL